MLLQEALHEVRPEYVEYVLLTTTLRCSCGCKMERGEENQTELPTQTSPGQDVPPDIVVSVIRSSSGIFNGTLSAVSSLSLARNSGDSSGDPPPYEEPPSYKAATEVPCAVSRAVTV